MATVQAQTVAVRPVTPVGILAAKLERVLGEIAAVDGVGADVVRELREAHALAAGLEPYVAASTTPESPALARLAQRTLDEDWGARSPGTSLEPEMLSGHVEGQLLKCLVAATQATRVLEIGMFTGYSALAMAETLPEGGIVVACEVDAPVARFAQESFDQSPCGDKIDVRVAPAQETLAALARAGDAFDLIFVDADKAGYAGYLDAILDGHLLAPGGLIAVDNTLMQGRPWVSEGEPTSENGAAIAAFNARVARDPRVEQVVLAIRDGLTLIRRV